MISWRTVGTEVSALGVVALSMPLRLVVRQERFESSAPHATPVVLVHGLFGDPTNFLLLRSWLGAHGVRNFASFAYAPRIDYQRLAPRLGEAIAAVCEATGASEVDVVGHSLGGLVSRYLVELSPSVPIRRLVTLGSPYFAARLPPQELAIFAASDPFIPPPHPDYGPLAHRMVLVPHCGHWGLLCHPAVLAEVGRFLTAPEEPVGLAERLALGAC